MIFRRILTAILGLTLLCSPALAADRKPLVLGASGQQQQIQSGDTLSVPAAKVTGISGSTQCVQASSAGLLSGTGSACGSGGGSGACTAGTTFPGSPTSGQCVFRTDRGIDYYYDSGSTHWLSIQKHVIIAGENTTFGASFNIVAIPNPWFGIYDIYLDNAAVVSELTAGSTTYSSTLYYFAGASFTSLGSSSTSGDAANTYASHSISSSGTTISNATVQGFQLNVTRSSGTANMQGISVAIPYRLIG